MGEEAPAAAVLAAVAAEVRAEYCAARNRWHREHDRRETDWGARPVPRYDGGVDGGGRRHASVWDRVARFAVRHGLDPRRLVRVQFAVRAGRPPEPGQLATPEAAALYRSRDRAAEADVGRLFEFQKARAVALMGRLALCRVRRGWSAADVHRAVLGDMLAPLSALFRYCVAAREGYADLAAAFADAALLQYAAQPADYDRVWGDWVPPALKARAVALAAAALGPGADPPAAPADPPPAGRRIVVD